MTAFKLLLLFGRLFGLELYLFEDSVVGGGVLCRWRGTFSFPVCVRNRGLDSLIGEVGIYAACPSADPAREDERIDEPESEALLGRRFGRGIFEGGDGLR